MNDDSPWSEVGNVRLCFRLASWGLGIVTSIVYTVQWIRGLFG